MGRLDRSNEVSHDTFGHVVEGDRISACWLPRWRTDHRLCAVARAVAAQAVGDEVVALASELAADGHMPIDGTDIRVAISKITHEMPTPADADRVRRRLEAAGWPISDDFDTPGT